MENGISKNVAIIGIGNCGGQVALLAEQRYPELFDCIYINSSAADLAMITTPNAMKYKIGKNDTVEGSGKNRTKMKEYLQEDLGAIFEDGKITECLKYKKYCYIIASAAGGTGSGSAPVLMEILRRTFIDVNFTIVAVLPQLGASLMEHGNELEFMEELYTVLGPTTRYMIYDNETTVDQPPTRSLEIVNENIVEDLRILTGVDNYPTPYESIDSADMESINTTPGRTVVVRVTKGITEKVLEDIKIDDLIIKQLKSSCHAETNRDKRVVRYGVITYFTPEVNALYAPQLDKLTDFLGVPVERFNHNAVNSTGKDSANFIYLIAAGLSPINDRVQKVTNRVEELKRALATDDTTNYILAEGSSYDVMEARKREQRRLDQPESMDPKDIFSKFMKK